MPNSINGSVIVFETLEKANAWANELVAGHRARK
jgi:hypothetical protein